MHQNPTDEQVWALAEQIYEKELRNEHMPAWPDVPSIYGRGCLNDAATRLGWKPESTEPLHNLSVLK